MRIAAMVVLTIGLTLAGDAQNATFYRIGTGGISGISPDGNIVTGTDGLVAFYWTERTGRVRLGEGEGWAVTNDTMIVGRFRDPDTQTPNGTATLVAGYWKNGEWTSIGGLPGVDPFDSELYSHGYGVSHDGSTIVGMGWYPNYRAEAFYWTEATGVVPLGRDGNLNSRANDASFDGSIVVGWDGDEFGPDRRAYLWDPEPHFLGSFDPLYPVGECTAISPSGSYVVGASAGHPFVWTPTDSLMQRVIDPITYPNGGFAADVNDNGMIAGGIYIAFNDPRAFFKHSGEDPTFLKEYLVNEMEVEGLEKWTLMWANAVSDDGSVLAGWGIDKSHVSFQDAYVVRFAPPSSDVDIQLSIDDKWLPIPVTGDTVPMNISFTNLCSDSVRTSFSVHLKVPDGKSKRVMRSHSLALAPGQTLKRTENLRVIASGPEGAYSVVALWGDYLENSSTFSFEKSGGVEKTIGDRGFVLTPSLGQNSPNPCNPTTTISFSLPAETHVILEVFNTLGQRVAVLADEVRPAGTHNVVFDGRGLASGLYWYRMQAGKFTQAKKLLLLK